MSKKIHNQGIKEQIKKKDMLQHHFMVTRIYAQKVAQRN